MCSCLVVWFSGCLGVYLSSCVVVELSSYLIVSMSSCLVWLSGWVVWLSGCLCPHRVFNCFCFLHCSGSHVNIVFWCAQACSVSSRHHNIHQRQDSVLFGVGWRVSQVAVSLRTDSSRLALSEATASSSAFILAEQLGRCCWRGAQRFLASRQSSRCSTQVFQLKSSELRGREGHNAAAMLYGTKVKAARPKRF